MDYISKSLNEIVFVGPLGPMIHPTLSSLPQIAIDGGEPFSQNPLLWIGDGDSLNRVPVTKNIIQLRRQKDLSDLAYSLSLLKDHPLQKLHLWGFSGGRMDHELFNLGETALFLKNRAQTEVHYYRETDVPVLFFYSAGTWDFNFAGTFSVGALETLNLTLTGALEYPIPHRKEVAPLSSFCLSNKARGEFKICADSPFFIVKENS